MCSDTYVLSEAAKLVADAEFALRQKLCEYDTLAQKNYALQMLRARGDEGAAQVLLRHCPDLVEWLRQREELAGEQAERPPLGIAAN